MLACRAPWQLGRSSGCAVRRRSLWAARRTLARWRPMQRSVELTIRPVDRCLAGEAPETPVEETWLLDPATQIYLISSIR
jgi:hypothetical protein